MNQFKVTKSSGWVTAIKKSNNGSIADCYQAKILFIEPQN